MTRLAALLLAMGLLIGSLFGMPRPATATPFADVPLDRWAYQYLQALATDGLVDANDGRLNADRTLTRYEMATIVARVIARLEADGLGRAALARSASKADLDKLQKLVDALKDELDALGVRTTNVEDAAGALERRTRFAEAAQFHGTISSTAGLLQRPGFPAAADPLVATYLATAAGNDPFAPARSLIRSDDRFTFVYTVNENLTVALPVRVLNYQVGGAAGADQKVTFVPDAIVHVARAGALTNVTLKDGTLDELRGSRTGLAYRAPDVAQAAFNPPWQPFGRGVAFGATINGTTDVSVSFGRLDPVVLDTQPGVLNVLGSGTGGYLSPIVPAGPSYVQSGPPGASGGALASDTFNAGGAALSAVALRRKAVAGTVYISSYAAPGGATATYNNAGVATSGGGAAPAFAYIDATNAVVFPNPLPPGSAVTVTYVGLQVTSGAPQRYQLSARLNQKLLGIPGAELGFSLDRIFDQDDALPDPTAPASISALGNGFGLISDTVFGLDTQLPLPLFAARGKTPVVFGEAAFSRYTGDVRNIAPVGDSAGVVGIRLAFGGVAATVQFAAVGPNFVAGTPLRYSGSAPAVWQNYKGVYLPEFFGFANNLAVNQRYDAGLNAALAGKSVASATAGNPNLTFIYPVWNPFSASGPGWYSTFAPNQTGASVELASPVRAGRANVEAHLFAQHQAEIAPNANAMATFGTQFGTTTRATYDTVTAGATFRVPALGRSVAINVAAGIDRLRRNDPSLQSYVPYNPTLAAPDPVSLANQALAGAAGGTFAQFAPNYVDLTRTRVAAGATVPLTSSVLVGAGFNRQAFNGAAGSTLGTNVTEQKDQVDLSLTYNVPRTSSSVQFVFRNNTYRDVALPAFNFKQNREDLNVTIRF